LTDETQAVKDLTQMNMSNTAPEPIWQTIY